MNECLPSTDVGLNMGKDVAAGPAQDGERVKSGPLAWHCGCHILIYPSFRRSSIQGRPTIVPCLSETEARALKGTICSKEKHLSAFARSLARTVILQPGLAFPKIEEREHSSVVA